MHALGICAEEKFSQSPNEKAGYSLLMTNPTSNDGSFTAEAKATIARRSGYQCQICGKHQGTDFHHRAPRKMGGTSGCRASILSSPSNGLLLCRECHHYVETHRGEAYDNGWLVHAWDNPAEVFALLRAVTSPNSPVWVDLSTDKIAGAEDSPNAGLMDFASQMVEIRRARTSQKQPEC